jgi:predicted ATP-grasp superfamily ATP-dependent carboligase
LPVLSASGFGKVIIPFPDLYTWRRMADKAEVLAVAGRLGIKVPDQIVLEGPPTDPQIAELAFPVVLKPSRSLVAGESHRFKLAVRHAQDRRQLNQIVKSLPDAAWPVLAQRRVSGPGIGIFLLLKDGALLAQFAHRRILEKPPWGGVSVCSEAVAVSPRLVEQSAELLRAFSWSGVAMVEYKVDRHTGDPYLMEVNGRFWGSLQLAIDAGVDFPRLLVESATGRDVVPVLGWRSGIRLRWRLGEVDHLIARLRRSTSHPHRFGELPSLGSAFRHAILPAWHPRSRGEVFRLNDPRPGLVELAGWVRGR